MLGVKCTFKNEMTWKEGSNERKRRKNDPAKMWSRSKCVLNHN